MISYTNFRQDVPTVELAQVVEFLDNKRKPITEKDRVAGPYPYYGANGLQDYVADWIFDEDLILLAEDGGHFENADRGVAYKITGKTWVNNHAHVLRAKNVDVDYLKHVLKNMDLMPYVNGATRLKLTKSSAEKIKIPLPTLAEQQRIAAILDKAAQIKAKREQTIAKLDELAQSTFVEMFGDVNGKNMSSAKLQDICEFKYGKPLPEKNRAGGDINVFGSNGVVGLHNQSLTTGETIIIGRKGSFGEINFCETSCYPIDTTFYIDKTATKQNLTWLRFALSGLGLNKMNKSAAVPGLSREDAYRQQLMVPELVEQVSFENQIKAIKRQVKIQYSSLKGVDALTASLQHRAFTTGFAA